MVKYYTDDQFHLSLFELTDAELLFKVIDNNREHLGRWMKFPSATMSIVDSERFIERVRMRYAKHEGY